MKKQSAKPRQIKTAIGTRTFGSRTLYLFREVNLGNYSDLNSPEAIAKRRKIVEIYAERAALVNDTALGRIYPKDKTHYSLIPLDKTTISPPPQLYRGLSKLLVEQI